MTLLPYQDDPIITTNGILRILRNNRYVLLFGAVGQCLGSAMFWKMPAPLHTWGTTILFLVSAVIGVSIGYSAYGEDGVKPVRVAIGVAWRTALVWVLVNGTVEAVIVGPDSFRTAVYSPSTFSIHALIIGVMFVFGHMVHALRSGNMKLTREVVSQWIAAIGMLVAVATLTLTLYDRIAQQQGRVTPAAELSSDSKGSE